MMARSFIDSSQFPKKMKGYKMKVKSPVMIDRMVEEVYEVDVEGKVVVATYTYYMGREASGQWKYDLTPCFEGLDEDEIFDLEEEFDQALMET